MYNDQNLNMMNVEFKNECVRLSYVEAAFLQNT